MKKLIFCILVCVGVYFFAPKENIAEDCPEYYLEGYGSQDIRMYDNEMGICYRDINVKTDSDRYYEWRAVQPRYIEDCMWGKTPQ